MESNTDMKKDGRGGARQGAGRKRTTARAFHFCAAADVAAILGGVANKSEFICRAVRELAAREGLAPSGDDDVAAKSRL